MVAILIIILVLIISIVLIGISMFTSIKIPFVDSYIANAISNRSIKEKREKNNLVCEGWRMTHYDLDEQDFRWENKVDGRLVAKLRIKYSSIKETYSSYYSRWMDNRMDALEEIIVVGEPKFLLKLFGLSTRVYKVVSVSEKPNLKRIFGNINHPVIMIHTKLKQDS